MSCNSFSSRANKRVAIQTLETITDDYGGQTENWPLLAEVWAVIEPKSGDEIYINGQLQSRVDAKITIRYQSAIADTREAGKCRVVFGERTYDIKAVKNLAQDMKTEGIAFQELICVEK